MNLSLLWLEHSQSKFPDGYGGVDVNGICVSSLDSSISGCISSYINHGSKNISAAKLKILQENEPKLEGILIFLEGDSLKYFSRLHEMCSYVISEAKAA